MPLCLLLLLFPLSCTSSEKPTDEVMDEMQATESEEATETEITTNTDDDTEEPLALELQTEFGDPAELEVRTDGIFAIWWYPSFEHAADAEVMFAQLNAIRDDCLERLEMKDPPNPEAGFYYNVYIHHGDDDAFPNYWANGQGTDRYGMPYLSLPEGAHIDPGNLYHEGFHIFQYSANAPGFAYAGDSQWYIEATAQWYLAENLPDEESAFVEAGALIANPQLTLWHSFENHAPGDPTDWLYQVRQYGMHSYLYYLTAFEGVSPDIITSGFYSGTTQSPQEMHYDEIGGDSLRAFFANWAAHNTGGLDYLSPAQVARAQLEVEYVGDPENLHPYILELTDAGTEGEWLRPPEAYTARGWAYNVVHIQNTQDASYTFRLDGDESGTEGAASHFESRLVVMGASETTYSEMEMSNDLDGEGVLVVGATDTDIYLVIAAVPEHFSGNQSYGYAFRIDREPTQ